MNSKNRLSTRILSFILLFVLIFSLVPITPVQADDSMANGIQGSFTISGGGPGSNDWNRPPEVDGMWGYRITVRFAPLSGYDENKEPTYDWANSFQCGNPVYVRAENIGKRKGSEMMPSFYGKGSIYDLTTNGKTWNDIKQPVTSKTPFEYYVTSTSYPQSSIDKSNKVWYEEFKDLGLKAGETKGHKAVQDWVNRIYDMELDLKPANKSSGEYVTSASPSNVIKALTPQTYKLTFPNALGTNGGNKTSNNEYLKSYFLSPTIINMIAWVSKGGFDTGDFVYGRYHKLSDGSYEYPQGTYKIYIEPCAYRMYDGTFGVMTFHDIVSHYELKQKGLVKDANASVMGAGAMEQMSQAMYLEEPEESLGMDSSDMVTKYSISVLENQNNALGLWVLSSPALLSYQPAPRILKTYAAITGVNPDGTLELTQMSETVIETTNNQNFYTEGELKAKGLYSGEGYKLTGDDNAITTVPKIDKVEQVHNENFSGVAILNDIIGTPIELNDTTKWESELLPKDEEKEVHATADEVKGLNTGLVTGSDVMIEATRTLSLEQIDKALDILKETAETESTNAVAFAARGANLPAFVIIDGKAISYDYWDQIQLGKVDKDKGQVVKLEPEEKITDSANNTVLRYIVKPEAQQLDVVKIIDEKTKTTTYITGEIRPLDQDGDTVNIQKPVVDLPEGVEDPKLIEWVTNPELPFKDISTGDLPDPIMDGKTGTTEDPIPEYPDEPIIHNLYVEWEIVIPAPPSANNLKDHVPEWRLSKFRDSLTQGQFNPVSAFMNLNLTPDSTTHVSSTLTPSGNYNFFTVNPNGQKTVSDYSPDNMNMKTISTSPLSNYSSVPVNTWFHSKALIKSNTTISHSKPYAFIALDGNLNMIKSTESAGLVAATWLTPDGTKTGLQQHNVETSVLPKGYSGQDTYDKNSELKYGIYNKDTYVHSIAVWYHYTCHHRRYSHDVCACYNTSEIRTPSSASYLTADYNMTVTFDRYKQQNTDTKKLVVQPEVKNESGITSIKYQLNTELKVYPEYGMLFANDKGDESIKWVVGDQARKISPVVYQTLQHKVYVVPNSNGTSYATDSRAITQANSLGEGKKQVIYKGAGVNTAFQLYRDSEKKNKALLTVKTYALDFRNDKSDKYDYTGVKSSWGNTDYNSYKEHESLLKAITEKKTADATEKLLVDSPAFGSLDYTGAIKSLKTGPYNLVKYSMDNKVDGGNAVVFEHRLLVRGGAVIGVVPSNRSTGKSEGTPISMEQLKTQDLSLYNALLNMNLYNESIDRSKTVFSTFEHLTGDALTEGSYVTMLEGARKEADSEFTTPASSAVSEGKGWYSEDTTVLVVKEYVSNYEVPSISFGDKLSMSVKGLETPIDKNLFFKTMGKGHTYLRYDLKLGTKLGAYSLPNEIDSYFEYTSFGNDTVKGNLNKDYFDDLSFGQQKVDYLVPNVSVSDTTRLS